MKIKVVNNTKDVKVDVKNDIWGNVVLTIDENRAEVKPKTLANAQPGEIVQLGNYKFIVLGHGAETTALLSADCVYRMPYTGTDWRTSPIRDKLNTEFYGEMCNIVGEYNVIQHTTNLTAVDGSGSKMSCLDKISMLTLDNYRRYSEFIKNNKESFWWLVTRNSYRDATTEFTCVDTHGVPRLNLSTQYTAYGVRPFCILRSTVRI